MPSDDDLALADEVSGQLMRLVRLMERKQAQYQAEHPDAVERATYFLLVHLVKGGPRRALGPVDDQPPGCAARAAGPC